MIFKVTISTLLMRRISEVRLVVSQADLPGCADRCAQYNLNNPSVPCAGASLDWDAPAPNADLGFECWLKWSLTETGDPTQGVDAVRLQSVPVNTVFRC